MGLVRGAATIGAILCGMLALLAPAVAEAAFPGDNGRIAYVGPSADEPNAHIFTILPDGSGEQQLTDSPTSDCCPSWSADGRSLVFGRDRQVMMMSADGGDQIRLVDGLGPSFSPSGHRIAYSTHRYSEESPQRWRNAIFTVRTDGTDPRRLVTSAPVCFPVEPDAADEAMVRRRRSGLSERCGWPTQYVAGPRYSPTGRRIVFSGTPKGKRKGGIWSIRRDGSRLRRLTVSRCDSHPDYSPNARRIVFTHAKYCAGHPPGIHVMRADGSHERAIPDTDGIWRFDGPAWAPAGGRIVASFFLSTDLLGGGGCIDLHTMSPKGADRQRVTNNCPQTGFYASEPSWQPLPRSP
jgi:Tol biopolymer transport system component